MIKLLPLEFLGVSHRILWKNIRKRLLSFSNIYGTLVPEISIDEHRYSPIGKRPRYGNHRRPYQKLLRFKEVLDWKTGLSDLWNVIHKEEKAMLEHTIRLHTRKTIYLNLSLFTCIFYVLSPRTVHIKLSNFILFSLENDDMEPSKRCAKLLSLDV